MVVINIKEKSNQYEMLFDLILKNSIYASFHLPNFESCDKVLGFNKITDFINKSEDSYKQYVKKCNRIIDIIKDEIISVSVAKQYGNSKFGYYSLIYKFKLSKHFIDYLSKCKSLFCWDRDEMMPEDICFYKPNKRCYISTISHEESIILYEETKKDLLYLQSKNIIYQKIPKLLFRRNTTPIL